MIERKMLTGHTPALLRRKLEDFLRDWRSASVT